MGWTNGYESGKIGIENNNTILRSEIKLVFLKKYVVNKCISPARRINKWIVVIPVVEIESIGSPNPQQTILVLSEAPYSWGSIYHDIMKIVCMCKGATEQKALQQKKPHVNHLFTIYNDRL